MSFPVRPISMGTRNYIANVVNGFNVCNMESEVFIVFLRGGEMGMGGVCGQEDGLRVGRGYVFGAVIMGGGAEWTAGG